MCNLLVHCIDKIALPGHQSLHLGRKEGNACKYVKYGLKFNTHACVIQHSTARAGCVCKCVCFVYFCLVLFAFEVGENAATTRGVADATATKI